MPEGLRTNRTKRGDLKKALSRFAINDKNNRDEVRQIDALLRFYFAVDPDTLDDNEWAARWNELKFALDYDAKRQGITQSK